MSKLLSVVVSVYNEEAVLEQFYKVAGEVLNHIDWDYELPCKSGELYQKFWP